MLKTARFLSILLILGMVLSLVNITPVQAAEGLKLSRIEGYYGDTLIISGAGFYVHEQVAVSFSGNPENDFVVNSSASGSIKKSFRVPNSSKGTKTFTATGLTSGRAFEAEFSVIPKISLTKWGTQNADNLTVAVYGFSAFESGINITINQTELASAETADQYGYLDNTFVIPDIAPGTYIVTASGNDGSRASANLTFLKNITLTTTVTTTSRPPTPTPTGTPEPFTLVSKNPPTGADNVSVDTVIEARFNRALLASTVDVKSFLLKQGLTTIEANITYNTTSNTATLTPLNALSFDTTYSVEMTSEIKDIYYNQFEGTTWAFTTEGQPTPPQLISFSPADNSSGIEIIPTILARFDSALDEDTINSNTFRLKNGTRILEADVSYQPDTRKAYLSPKNDLEYNNAYTVELTTGITDIQNHHFTGASWTFFTRMAPTPSTISISSAAQACENSTLDALVKIDNVTDLAAYVLVLSYDPNVIKVLGAESGVEGVSPGLFGNITVPCDIWEFSPKGHQGKMVIIGHISPIKPMANGPGYVLKVHFGVIGTAGQSSSLSLYYIQLYDNMEQPVPFIKTPDRLVTVVGKQAPVIYSSTPAEGRQGENIPVIISGKNLEGAASLNFGQGITVNSENITDNATTIRAEIVPDLGYEPGFRDISLSTPNGTAALNSGFTVKPSAMAPFISTLNPSIALQGTTQEVDINGFNLTGITDISFGNTITVNNWSEYDSNHLGVNITIDNLTPPGLKDVSVTNANGTATGYSGLRITPRPVISAVVDSSAVQGKNLEVSILGTGLRDTLAVSFGSSITVNSFEADSLGEFINANISISTMAEVGSRDITVTTCYGSAAGNFIVNSAAPVIQYIEPGTVISGDSSTVHIGGENLNDFCGLSFGSDILINRSWFDSAAGEIIAELTVLESAESGSRDVLVANLNGTAASRILVNNVVYFISQVTPAALPAGSSSASVIINGAGLSAVTELSFGGGITIHSFVITGNTGIAADITIDAGAATGSRDVSIVTPDGTYTRIAAFAVTDSSGGGETPVVNTGTYSVTGIDSMLLIGTLNTLILVDNSTFMDVAFEYWQGDASEDQNHFVVTAFPGVVYLPGGLFTYNLSGLWQGQVYSYRALASNGVTDYQGEIKTFTLPGPIMAVNAPPRVDIDTQFNVKIDVSRIEEFDNTSYILTYDSTVIKLIDVESGNINGTVIPVMWNQISNNTCSIVQKMDNLTGVTGSGYAANFVFQSIGEICQVSAVSLNSVIISNTPANHIIPCTISGQVMIGMIKGDIDSSGKLDAVDITTLERMIAQLQSLNSQADVNGDGEINALDITQTKRYILGMDPIHTEPFNPADNQTLKVLIPNSPTENAGWPLDHNEGAQWYTGLFAEPLVYYTSQGELEPCLAESWEMNADNASYRIDFHLRQGVRFQDGTVFDAAAVKFQADQVIAAGAPNAALWKSVDVLDNYTVRFNLYSYQNSFWNDIYNQNMFFVSPTQVTLFGIDYAREHPAGTGPFKLIDFVKEVKASFIKNASYWQTGKPFLKRIEVWTVSDNTTQKMLLESGQADVMFPEEKGEIINLMSEMKKEGFSVAQSRVKSYMLLPDSNNDDSPWSNLKVRQALDYAIDREAIAQNYGFGFLAPGEQLAPDGNPVHDNTIPDYDYDPHKALQLLKEAGYPNGFNTKIYGQPADLDYLNIIQAYLAAVGITAEIQVIDPALFMEYYNTGWNYGLLCLTQSFGPNFAQSVKEQYPPFATCAPSLAVLNGMADLIDDCLAAVDPDDQNELNRQLNRMIYNERMVIVTLYGGPGCVFSPKVKDADWFYGANGYCSWRLAEAWIEK